VAPLGLRVDATSPWVDARLPDGSRVQTKSLCTPFCRITGAEAGHLISGWFANHPIEPPSVRDAFQHVLASFLEDDAGAGRQILHSG
jgi:hypothetical protein